VRTFPLFNKGRARGGLIVEPKIRRNNSYDKLALRTIGLYRENAQTVGIEGTLDSILQGVNGSRIDQKLTGGVWMPIQNSATAPQNGKDVVTTLDISIQGVAMHALMTKLREYDCQYGTVVVIEVNTGKIRALVNLGRQKDGDYAEDFNYALLPTEPGSTFKLATLTALARDGLLNVERPVNCMGGARQFYDRVMKDSHHGLGVMPIREAYAHSSNVAMATLADQNYASHPKRFTAHLKALHLDVRTGIDLRGERTPHLIEPGSEHWRKSVLPWMAIGYGVTVTPLHTCMLYNALANNGRMMKPYLVSAIREYGRDIQHFNPTVLVEQMAPPESIAQLKSCAEEVVLSGTGKALRSPYYKIAGKTGTAQVYDKGIPYSAHVYQGSFVGYFPADKPKYTMIVVVRTRANASNYYGGVIALPVFNMIADKIFATGMGQWDGPLDSIAKANNTGLSAGLAAMGSNYQVLLRALGQRPPTSLAPDAVTSIRRDSSRRVVVRSSPVVHGLIPDVRGMGLKDAVFLLENEGLKVKVYGRGSIQAQTIQPGTRITKGQKIMLLLS
jgi:cell division protein FtsI (penicillin-binding protein 3)